MALVVYDRVQETTATTGTGSITLAGAVAGYQSFAVVGNTNTTFYCIVNNTAWEVGIGTYSTTGPTLARTTVLSNSNGTTSPITLVGASNVFCTYPSEKSVNLDASGNVTPLGTIASGTWQGTTVGVAYGGTGVTTSTGANSNVLRDANSNITTNNVLNGYTAVVSTGGTIVLTAASTYYQKLSGTLTQTFQLPDATTLPNGTAYVFDNDSTGVLTITNNASATVDTVAAGAFDYIYLEDNSTSAGSWGSYSFIPAAYDFSNSTASFGNATITNATWNGNAISSGYGGTGLTTFTAANYALYSTSASALTAGTLPVAAGGTGLTTFTAANYALYSTSASALTAGTLPVAAGGTGLTSLTAGYIPYGNGTGALSSSSGLTFNGTNFSTTGSATATALIPSGSTVPTNGLFLPATNAIGFSTNTTERLRIDSAGNVAIGSSGTLAGVNLYVNKSLTGATGSSGCVLNSIIQSDVTVSAYGFYSALSTQTASFTVPSLVSFHALQGTIGAGSTVSNQYGFEANANMTGATSNTGFFSNIPSGTNRWNFYAGGTASNYFAGPIGLATTGPVYGTHNLRISANGLTSADIISVVNEGSLPSTVTDSAVGIYSSITTSAAAFTLPSLVHFYAAPGVLGAGSTLTSQYGFFAQSTLSSGTNNYGFYSNIASAANTYNFYAAGTAVNYFAGNVGIGTSSPTTTLSVSSAGGSQKRAIYVSSGSGAGSAGGIYITSNSTAGSNGATYEAVGQRNDTNLSGGFSGQLALAHLRTDAAISTYGTILGRIGFGGNPSGTSLSNILYSAQITGIADTAWSSSTAMGTALAFYTGATGTDINGTIADFGSERMRIDSSGNVAIGTAVTSNGRLTSAAGTTAGVTTQIVAAPLGGTLGQESQILFGYTFSNNWAGVDYGVRFSGAISYGAYNAGSTPRDASMKFYTGTSSSDTPVERMRIDNAGNVGIGTTSPAVTLAISSTDAILVPVGTTAQRPTAATGYFRFNSSISRFEGYNGTGWGSLGGATGGGTDAVFYLNGQTVTTTYAIPSGQSAHSVGPITISSGVTVTVPSGSRWVIS